MDGLENQAGSYQQGNGHDGHRSHAGSIAAYTNAQRSDRTADHRNNECQVKAAAGAVGTPRKKGQTAPVFVRGEEKREKMLVSHLSSHQDKDES